MHAWVKRHQLRTVGGSRDRKLAVDHLTFEGEEGAGGRLWKNIPAAS